MQVKLILLTLLVLFLAFSKLLSQQLVEAFKMPTPITVATIEDIEVDTNDRILLAGNIAYYEGIEQSNLLRLHADGTLDDTFNFNSEALITEIGLLSTGEIIALGVDSLYKVSESGERIKTLKIGTSAHIAIKEDNIYLVSYPAKFEKFDADLAPVVDFNSGNFFSNGGITAIAMQGDKVLVAGTFNEVNGITKNDIVRFDTDGNLDDTFDTGTGTNEWIGALAVQADGKIILTNSQISTFNGVAVWSRPARLNKDGSVDIEFNPPWINGPNSATIFQGDKILVSTLFDDGVTTEHRLIRLNNDGTLDEEFNIIDSKGSRYAVMSNHNIIGNSLNESSGLKKFTAQGLRIDSFSPHLEGIGHFNTADHFNDFIIVSGDFHRLDSLEMFQLAKIDLNGNVDPNFAIAREVNTNVVSELPIQIQIQEENEIYVSLGNKLIKLDQNGNPDPGFNTPSGVVKPSGKEDPYFARLFSFLENGQIVTAGYGGMYLLNADGTQNTSFDFENTGGVVGSPIGFGKQSSNKILYGSGFTEINGVPVNKLVRVDVNGVIDESFDIGDGPDLVQYINILPNDEIIVKAYEFNGFDSELGIHKLGENGHVDEDFLNNLKSTSTFEQHVFFMDGINFKDESFLMSCTDFLSLDQFIAKIDLDGHIDASFSLRDGIKVRKYDETSFITPVRVGEKHFLLLGDFELEGSNDITKGLLFLDNDIPVITSTAEAITTIQDTPVSITLTDLNVEDPDNTFPGDFSISIQAGENYSVSGNEIMPAPGFSGSLSVPIIVNDGIDDSETYLITVEVAAVVGVDDELISQNFSVYPNPFQEVLNVEAGEDIGPYNVQVLDMRGDVIYSSVHHTGTMQVDMSLLKGGMYILSVHTKEQVGNFKLVKD